MPAAAMGTSRKAIRTATRRMITHRIITHRTIMASILPMMSTIIMTSIASMITITAIPMLITTNKAPARPRRRAVVPAGAISEGAARPIDGQDGMKEGEAAALYRLMTWLSPAFPIGAFSYSSGIEWAIEAGDITDAKSLKRWLSAMLGLGGGFCDAVFFAHAYRAIVQKNDTLLREVAELAAAFAPSKE